jgi:hypothetical protein
LGKQLKKRLVRGSDPNEIVEVFLVAHQRDLGQVFADLSL